MVERAGLPFEAVHAGPIHGVNVLRLISSAFKLVRGLFEAWRLIGRWRPDVMLLTGGWAVVPIAQAGWWLRVPIVTFVPDIEPALTLKLLGRVAVRVTATVGETARYFRPGLVTATGYPLRRQVVEATRDRALEFFGLDEERPTLLVFGGSRGARSLNLALTAILPELLGDGVQVIHISGSLDWPWVREYRETRLTGWQRNEYRAFEYLHDEMGLALAAADLVVSRAGASTLGEFPYFGLPAVLVPYPHAWRYQKVNAEYLADRGAALILEDAELGEKLLPTVRGLLSDQTRLARMRENMMNLARPDGARNIARVLIEVAEGSGTS